MEEDVYVELTTVLKAAEKQAALNKYLAVYINTLENAVKLNVGVTYDEGLRIEGIPISKVIKDMHERSRT